MILQGYADGGIIGPVNPCKFGGTWAYVLVGERGIYQKESGVVLAGSDEIARKEVVTNNDSEYYALLRLLCSLPDEWSGRVYSDSRVTIQRFFNNVPADVPKHWAEMLGRNLRRLGNLEPILLAGHPTRRDLVNGYKGGHLVSEYNVLCDRLCTREAENWKRAMKLEFKPRLR